MGSFRRRRSSLLHGLLFPRIVRKNNANNKCFKYLEHVSLAPRFNFTNRLRVTPPSLPAYQITYHLNSTNSNAATVDVLNPSARQYTVTSLKPESVYVFRITAQTRKGWGEAAEALVVTTEKRGNTDDFTTNTLERSRTITLYVFAK